MSNWEDENWYLHWSHIDPLIISYHFPSLKHVPSTNQHMRYLHTLLLQNMSQPNHEHSTALPLKSIELVVIAIYSILDYTYMYTHWFCIALVTLLLHWTPTLFTVCGWRYGLEATSYALAFKAPLPCVARGDEGGVFPINSSPKEKIKLKGGAGRFSLGDLQKILHKNSNIIRGKSFMICIDVHELILYERTRQGLRNLVMRFQVCAKKT